MTDFLLQTHTQDKRREGQGGREKQRTQIRRALSSSSPSSGPLYCRRRLCVKKVGFFKERGKDFVQVNLRPIFLHATQRILPYRKFYFPYFGRKKIKEDFSSTGAFLSASEMKKKSAFESLLSFSLHLSASIASPSSLELTSIAFPSSLQPWFYLL